MPQVTIVILDNSSSAINGDYQPTRWIAQIEAAVILIQAKMQQSHESAMGIALSGGKQVEVICTPSTDQTKVSSFLYGIKQNGSQKLATALLTTALALKHRANQNLAQRIICFVASTISDGIQQLKIICKKLKKSNIALDIIGIGDLSVSQRQKLQIMNQFVKSQVNSCDLLLVQPDKNVSDALFSSKILGGGEQNNQPLMMDEADDPELRMALELSLQQEQARLAAAGRENQNGQNNEEEDLEQRALRLSMEEQEKRNQKKE